MIMSDVGEERKYNGSKKSQEISCLCMRLLVLKFLTKKSHKIHSTKESIKIYTFFNTKRLFLSYERSCWSL